MEKTVGVLKALKKGSFVFIDEVPCKVDDISVSKSGKHGAAKARVDGIGLFDGRRRSIVKPADASVDVPILNKKKAQVLALAGDRAQLMDLEDYSNFELDIPEELAGKLISGQEISYYEVAGVRTLRQLK
ncbi:MAG: translation initiation factor IF-5A [Candidatus Aenigmarchaeota archaeon]|nr:translation initiation factor IF-5A [Candidatus Aenigmarchaeota archaeon]